MLFERVTVRANTPDIAKESTVGEYAKHNGAEVKIGTCEDMYYLRPEQRFSVKWLQGNVNPVTDVAELRFRFPFPDEDATHTPGDDGGNYERSIPIPGIVAGEGVEHCSVQFVAQAGYVCSIPCPEAFGATEDGGLNLPGGIRVHRNGFSGAVKLIRAKRADGVWVPVFECGGCGAMWRIAPDEIDRYVVAIRSEADRVGAKFGRDANPHRAAWWHALADRLAGLQEYCEASALVRTEG